MGKVLITTPSYPLRSGVIATVVLYTFNKNSKMKETYIHPTAIIGKNVRIGEGCYIGPYCLIGEKAEHKSYWDAEVGEVVIHDNVIITGHVTIDAGTEDRTLISRDSFIMKGVHIGHDAYVAEVVTISPHAVLGGHAKIGHHANIGMGAIIHQECEVGHSSMIGMGTIVTKKSSIHPYGKFVGSPARYLDRNRTGKHLTDSEYEEIKRQWRKK